MKTTGHFFTTIYGRGLVTELPVFVHRPYVVVTMDDLWHKFKNCFDAGLASVVYVKSMEWDSVQQVISGLPACNSVIGLGGGQAVDFAKLIAWTRRIPLFQVQTAMSVDAVFGHRAAIREDGKVRYIGWAVPEAIYIDFDVIQSAPPLLNRSGIGDILCCHTAHYDWQLAHKWGKTEAKWPYDPRLVKEAQNVLDQVWERLDEIKKVSEEGIRALTAAHRWAGAAFHNAGWNPRHIEGVEHFFFYTLEYLTKKPFIHGQPVCLGLFIGSALQENKADEILAAIHRVGVDIRPEAMGVTWEEVAEAMRKMKEYTETTGLWYTIVNDRPITESFIEYIKKRVEEVYGRWVK